MIRKYAYGCRQHASLRLKKLCQQRNPLLYDALKVVTDRASVNREHVVVVISGCGRYFGVSVTRQPAAHDREERISNAAEIILRSKPVNLADIICEVPVIPCPFQNYVYELAVRRVFKRLPFRECVPEVRFHGVYHPHPGASLPNPFQATGRLNSSHARRAQPEDGP